MPQINGAQLLADLLRLAEFGAYKSDVHRPTFSPQDIEARRWLAGRFAEAGLEASIDGIGNVFGRSRVTGLKLLLGSHTESQNHAGWLDRALGVIYGLEVARAFREDARTARSAIDVASWAECQLSPGAQVYAAQLLQDLRCAFARGRPAFRREAHLRRIALVIASKRSNPAERTAPHDSWIAASLRCSR
jgi:Zn-dependent M28 family amino/carboxypeptidase